VLKSNTISSAQRKVVCWWILEMDAGIWKWSMTTDSGSAQSKQFESVEKTASSIWKRTSRTTSGLQSLSCKMAVDYQSLLYDHSVVRCHQIIKFMTLNMSNETIYGRSPPSWNMADVDRSIRSRPVSRSLHVSYAKIAINHVYSCITLESSISFMRFSLQACDRHLRN
jgi:predicted metalloenzyme YecM